MIPMLQRRAYGALAGVSMALLGMMPADAAVLAAYALDGSGTDSSGNGLTLALSGTSAAVDRFGQAAGAVGFDGAAAYGEYAGGNLGVVSLGTSSWTVTAWVSTTGLAGAQAIVGRYRCG